MHSEMSRCLLYFHLLCDDNTGMVFGYMSEASRVRRRSIRKLLETFSCAFFTL